MKILTLNYEFPPLGGGASPVASELARGLAARGHSVDVLTMHYKGLPRFESTDGLNIRRVPVLRKRPDVCETHEMATYIASALPIATRQARRRGYEAVHCHFAVPTGPVAWWLKKRLRLPYILTSHGSDIPGYNPDRFNTEHRFMQPAIRAVLRTAGTVVSPSKYLASLISNLAPDLETSIKRIPNGIHTNSFRPTRKERIVLGTGRLLPRKGFQHVIQAMAALDSDYTLHLCGDGPMRGELERLVKRTGVPTVFHGWVDNQSTLYRDLLARAAIYALPSSRENASVSLLEAMSAGCAVVTSNTSGCPETVGDTGRLVAPGDVPAFTSVLRELINNPDLTESLGEQARERARTEFDWSVIVTEYEKLLQAVATT